MLGLVSLWFICVSFIVVTAYCNYQSGFESLSLILPEEMLRITSAEILLESLVDHYIPGPVPYGPVE